MLSGFFDVKGLLTKNFEAENLDATRNQLSFSNNTWRNNKENIEDFNQTAYKNKWIDSLFFDSNITRVIVGIDKERPESYVEVNRLVNKHNARIVNTVKINGQIIAAVVEVPTRSTSAFMRDVRTAKITRYIEPNMRFQASFIPNDPYWSIQWAPKKIEADWAWDVTMGNSSILVAVVDTGINYLHEDLVDNYIALGYDWVNNDSDPMDDHGHGTHCAGIIAAAINNSIGIAGLAQVSIMAEKGLDPLGYGYADWLANAIIHAVDQGADIISMSWGGYGHSQLIYEAIQYAYNAGVILIAAAGNDGTSLKIYPAAYDEVIAVTATDNYDQRAGWSSFGDWVELAAPGVDIYSTVPWGYESWSGTSMAAPHVAGIAALILSQFPNSSQDWLRLRLRYTADDLGDPGFDVYYGYGRVNARRAVEETMPTHELILMELETPPYAEPNTQASINVTLINFGAESESNVTIKLMANGSIVDLVTLGLLASYATAKVSCFWTPTTEGWYNVTAYITPVTGEENIENNVMSTYIYVGTPVKAFVLRSAGNVIPDIVANWQVLNTEWYKFGDTMIYIDYTTLDKEFITYEDINATGADVLIISCACDPYLWQLMDSEIEAIKRYVYEGHELIATSGTFFYMVPNNNKLAPLFGLNETTMWDATLTDLLHLLDTTHPIFYNVPNPFVFADVGTAVPFDWQWDSNELIGGQYAAIGHFEESAIVTYRGLVYLSPLLEIIPAYYQHHLQLLYNSIVWSRYRKPAHDLEVSLECPTYPDPGETVWINATVQNIGLSNETNVDLFILINDEKVVGLENFTLNSGEAITLSYNWTANEGTYNITAYSPPVRGEYGTFNNRKTVHCRVTYIPVIGFIETHGEELYNEDLKRYYENLGYFVNTIHEMLTPKLLKNYDLLVVGEDWYNIPWVNSEIKAVHDFIASGRGFVAIGDQLSSSIQEILSGYGITYTGFWGAGGPSDNFDRLHPIMHGVDYIYAGHPVNSLQVNPPGYWIASDARNEYTIIAGAEAGGEVLCLSDDFAAYLYNSDNEKMFKNIVEWMGVKYEHELSAYLDCVKFAEPGELVFLNITVSNRGKKNETNLELQIWINNTMVENVIIYELLTNAHYTLNYQWTPTIEGIYNITVYILPVLGENYIQNNKDTCFVRVESLPDILIVSDDDAGAYIRGTSLPEFELVLTSAGYEYFVWDESSMENPSLDFLTKFKVVIWTCGDYRSWAVDPLDAATLEQYLAQGGTLLLEGEDIGFDHNYDSFMFNVAHALYDVDDTGSLGLMVTDPIHQVTAGLPTNFYWLTDPPLEDGVFPINGGKEVIRYSGTSWTAVTVFDGTGINYGSVVYYAFPIYCVSEKERSILVVNSVEWLLATKIKHDIAILNLTVYPTQVYVGQTVNINLTVTNKGKVTESFTVQVYYENATANSTASLIEGHNIPPPNAMWIAPSTLSLANYSIGDRFNVTVWVNLNISSFGWQFKIVYDKTVLNAVRCEYTGLKSQSQFFQGLPTMPFQPTFGELNETYAYVMHGETLLGAVERKPGYGSLSWIEFEIVNIPVKPYEGILELEEEDTMVIDPALQKISLVRYSSVYHFGLVSSPLIGERQVQLLPETNATLTFTWNTTGLLLGNYTIKAVAGPVPGETNIEDNTFVNGAVEILWEHDVAVIEVSSLQTWIYEGQDAFFNVTVRNKGDFVENVTLTLYYNINTDQIIDTMIVRNLLPEETRTVTVVWNTIGVPPCTNYTITAVVMIDGPDNKMEDNILVDGAVKIRIAGDITADGKVDITDIAIIGHAFGAYPGHPRWIPEADINGDGKIEIVDMVLAAVNYGKC
jgi:subtilisin family serine protease